MTKDPVESAKLALLARRKDLVALWKDELSDEAQLLSTREIDWEDIAAQQREAGIIESIVEANVRELRGIVAALERIEDGKYGNCARCSEAIPWPRLEAIPWAPTCEPCAEVLEDEKKKTGTTGA